MAPTPLRQALALAVAAALVVPARAADVVAPVDAGVAPINGVGAAGNALNNPGVALVPAMNLGLSAPSLSAPGAPLVPTAVLAAPAPALVPSASPAASLSAAPRGVAPAAVPGAVPLASPSANPAAAPAFVAAPAAADGPTATFAQPVAAADAARVGAGKAAPGARGEAVAASAEGAGAGAFFDGSTARSALDAAPSAPEPAGHSGAPALRPSAKAAASSGPESAGLPPVAAPAPPMGALKAAGAKIAGFVTGLFKTGAAKSGQAAQPPPTEVAVPTALPEEVTQKIVVDKPVFVPAPRAVDEPLETAEGMLVHAPRALRFDALGYRVHFAPFSGSHAEVDAPVRVRVERSAPAEGTEALRERFAAFNSLIENNFAALELIAQSSSKMTVKTARLVLAKVEAMARDYAKMIGPENAVEQTVDVASLGIGFDLTVAGLSDADLLPAKAVAMVMPIQGHAMHALINRLHQLALGSVGRKDSSTPANLTVQLGTGALARKVKLVDLSEHPLVAGGRLVSPAFKALIEAMRRSKDQPKGSLLLQDHQFWGHFKLGAHSAEVYANFLPPDEGGMIRVRYQEWGTGFDNQTRLYYVARLLQRTGFHVEQDKGFLTAVVDKDHASQTVDQMTDTFALVIQALHATVGVDFALPLLVQGAANRKEVGERIDRWVEAVIGEGTLPFYKHDDHEAMVAGWSEYAADDAARERVRADMNRALARLGLPAIPNGEPFGQRTIDRFVNAPIEAAIARGQLAFSKNGALAPARGYHPLAALTESLVQDPLPAARLAEAVSSLDPGLLRFETVGSIGGLTVERAERALEPDAWLTVYALRDPKTGQIGLAEAGIADLRPGSPPRRLDAAALFARLAERGHPVAPFAPSANPPGWEHFARLLKAAPTDDASFGRRAQGLAASPGHGRPVLARVTYDKTKAARGGFVFVAPYTTPDDLDAIRASKAVITTSGGLLSHAAITTREMGIPAAILPRATWVDGAASLGVPEFGAVETVGSVATRAVSRVVGANLREGALVRLIPDSGVVEVFPDASSEALLEANAALERYDRTRDGAALTAWAWEQMKSKRFGNLQKAAVARETLDGMIVRALSRPEAAVDLGEVAAALAHAGSADAFVRSSIGELVAVVRREAVEFLADRRAAVESATTLESIERAVRQAQARAARVAAIATALGLTPDDGVADASRALGERAKVLSRRLLERDVAELEEHARLFPNATVEVLPRLKAAIAKAKRRGASPAVIAQWEAQVSRLEGAREAAMRAAAPAVLPLSQVLDVDVPRVGGKAAKLGEISEVVERAGASVPPGLALTVDAYRGFLREAGIADALERVAADPELSPDERAARARKLIMSARLDANTAVGRAILRSLQAEKLDNTLLAVRSSAVDEDGAEAAFAGAGDTHLFVAPNELLGHVKDVWASLWNPRAMLYRQTKGLTTKNLAQAVVIQAMAPAEVSGVAFTQDPVSGDSGRLIVNAAFGLGEGVVSGRVAPDQYVVGKSLGREILPPMIADKKLAVVRGKNGLGTVEHKMPAEWRRRRAMTPEKLEKLNAVAVALENHFGYALDIEFSFVGDRLFVLQARPVTNAAEAVEEAVPIAPKGKSYGPGAGAAKAAAADAEPHRIMFVCTGNTCRSPMAERLAKAKLRREGRSDLEILSRGLTVFDEGSSMSEGAKAALAERGVDADGHAALQFGDSDAVWADLILTMTPTQARALETAFPHAKGKIFTLAEYAGVGGAIEDPYGGSSAHYRAAASQISAAVDAALDRAEREPPAAPSAP